MHATEFLRNPEEHDHGPVVALWGENRYLKRAVLERLAARVVGGDAGEDADVTRFDGREIDLPTVLDELRMVSMWGDRRLVVVEDAQNFVSEHRSGLEQYVDQPSRKNLLVLDLKSFPKNTRLYKKVAASGLALECGELKGQALSRWISATVKTQHGKKISREAAAQLVELAGNELGLLEQELAKLSAYAGDRAQIDVDDVVAVVGGWKVETTWRMLDAVQEDDLGLALECLDKLLNANEAPQKLLGGVNFVHRRLANAVRATARRVPLRAALKDAGLFKPEDQKRAEAYLRRIGRANAERIPQWLLEVDGEMKGNSKLPPRLLLERLLVRLTCPR